MWINLFLLVLIYAKLNDFCSVRVYNKQFCATSMVCVLGYIFFNIKKTPFILIAKLNHGFGIL